MKITKILSAVAAVATTAALAVSANATLTVVDQTGVFKSGTGSWMPVVYSDGTFDASEKDVVDYGINCQDIASIEVTFTPAEPDWWEGEVGGAIVLSNKSATDSSHNWVGKEFWGVVDEDLGLETADDTKACVAVKTGDLQYTVTCAADDTNNVVDDYALVQVAFQEWSTGMTDITVLGMNLKDASGNLLLSYDANGNVTYNAADAAETPAAETAEAPAAETAEAADTAEAPADEYETATAEITAPAEDAAATVDAEAPAAATDSSKGSPDTGVEGVAAVAGVAVIAAGAVVLSKKRK